MDQLRNAPEGRSIDEPTEVQRRPGRRILWVVILALALVAGTYWWMHGGVEVQPEAGNRVAQPISVGAGTVGNGTIDVKLDALGAVTSLSTVTIKSQISGPLIKVEFKEGQEVKKNDLLAQIDPQPYEAALAQAQGTLARDQALLNDAELDLKRDQTLVTQEAVPRQTLDTQVALVAQYKGTVAADNAAIKTAQVNLDNCRILSPVDGRAGLRQVDEGNYVTPSDANGIVVITQIEPISVLFTVAEDRLQQVAQRLRQGAVLPVTAFDRTGAVKLDQGVLETFDSQIDPTTGTIKMRATFPNARRNLFPNQFVNIELLVDRHEGAVIAPSAAVQRGVPGTFVYLIGADGVVAVRKLSLGVADGENVEVLSGLAPGDKVVVDGADKLREGAKVVVRPEQQSTSPQPSQQPTAASAPPTAAPSASPAATRPAEAQAGQGK